MTVRDLLDLDAMRAAVLRAGEAGLDREVTGALIIEVPEVREWVKGGELLFSAAYAWREEPERLVDLVGTLHDAGVPGLVMKLGWYLEELPPAMVEQAEARGFPLFEIPTSIPYRDIIEPLYARLNEQASQQLARSEDLRVLTRSGLDDQSIEKVVSTLASHLQRPIHVVDRVDHALVVGSPDGIAYRRPIDDLDDERQAVVDALDAARVRRTPSWIELPDGPALGIGLIVGHESRGIIAVGVPEEEADRYLETELGHSAELISFLLLKRLALLEGRRQAASLFFASLMEGTISNEEATERALTLGLRLARPLAVLAIDCLGGMPPAVTARLHELAGLELSPLPHVLADAGEEPPILALVEPGEHDLGALLERLARTLQQAPEAARRTVVVAAGTPNAGLDGVRHSRSEALIAHATAEATNQGGVVRYEYLGVERLLAQVSAGPLALDYVTSVLGPVLDEPELLRTLEVFLQHGGNKVATAAAIPMHRSSLMYRLGKLGELLGVDLNEPERRHELWLALRLRRVLALVADDARR